MRFTTIIVLVFILTALSIGVALQEGQGQLELVDSSINNASLTLANLNITNQNISIAGTNIDGFYLVLEKYIQFIGTFMFETIRIGVRFGYENPDYFTPEFLITVLKLIIFALVFSLLIKPLGYLIVFIILGVIWLKDKIKKKNEQKHIYSM